MFLSPTHPMITFTPDQIEVLEDMYASNLALFTPAEMAELNDEDTDETRTFNRSFPINYHDN